MNKFDEIANRLDEELNGNIEYADYDNVPSII